MGFVSGAELVSDFVEVRDIGDSVGFEVIVFFFLDRFIGLVSFLLFFDFNNDCRCAAALLLFNWWFVVEFFVEKELRGLIHTI